MERKELIGERNTVTIKDEGVHRLSQLSAIQAVHLVIHTTSITVRCTCFLAKFAKQVGVEYVRLKSQAQY